MDNLNILVEAKREYMEQLSILICPVMIDVFDAMYQEAHTLSKNRKVLIMFQKLLKDVPEWSETMAKQHTDTIADRCAWFKDLVAAVFVSSVKILSAVRLSKDNKKISLKKLGKVIHPAVRKEMIAFSKKKQNINVKKDLLPVSFIFVFCLKPPLVLK